MMIDPSEFVHALTASGVTRFTGVPDSLLRPVCAFISANFKDYHLPTTNEGSAIGLAIGWYLGTGQQALVYLQNSAVGNVTNPLVSLADPQVWGIPMVLLIGWRGEMRSGRQLHDEPQHVKQGAITEQQLQVLGIPYEIISSDTRDIAGLVSSICSRSIVRRGPVALLVRKGTFSDFPLPASRESGLSREEAIATVLDALPPELRIVATTGMASRELFELRELRSEPHWRDILTVGGMGHASQIAAGLALAHPSMRVLCIDGDGALLMHAGGLAVTAGVSNLVHLVINNQRHDSVGGQPTHATHLDLAEIASHFGFASVDSVSRATEISELLARIFARSGSAFVEIKCRSGARAELGRPTISARQNVDEFRAHLRDWAGS